MEENIRKWVPVIFSLRASILKEEREGLTNFGIGIISKTVSGGAQYYHSTSICGKKRR